MRPSVLPDRSQERAAFRNGDLQLPQGEAVSACGQTLTVRSVGSVGAIDYVVTCGCGWQGLPLVGLPEVLRCEACDALAEGRLRNLVYAAVNGTKGQQ